MGKQCKYKIINRYTVIKQECIDSFASSRIPVSQSLFEVNPEFDPRYLDISVNSSYLGNHTIYYQISPYYGIRCN